MIRFRRRRTESDEDMRKRMIHETEVALLYGLRFPHRMVRIPTIEVGKGEFDPRFAAYFWNRVLDLHPGEN